MKKRFAITAVVVFFGAVVVLTGCQSANQQEQSGIPGQEVPLVPASKGPSGPPVVRGPTGPPPGMTGTEINEPQAVTETETVRYALPENPSVEVRQ